MTSLVIARLGSPIATVITGLVAAVLLSWRARSAIPGVVVIATVGAAVLAKNGYKALVERHRSPAELQLHTAGPGRLPSVQPMVVLEDHPFPSGHVTVTAALLGIIVVCVSVRRSRALRAWLTGLVVAGAVAVAVTRLYLGVHWLTDVIGGGILGGVFVTLGAALFSALQARSGRGGTTPRATGLSVADHRSVVDVRRADGHRRWAGRTARYHQPP
jgi:undecaprenyl-diphosphatase